LSLVLGGCSARGKGAGDAEGQVGQSLYFHER
jgi:hypothetical protein